MMYRTTGSLAVSILQPTRLVVLFGSLALAGCASLAPEYQRPDMPIPASYGLNSNTRKAQDVLPSWHDYFSDPVLHSLIDTALTHNPDLRIAVLRVEESRASFGIQRSERLPHFNADGQAARARVPGDLAGSPNHVTGGEYRAEVGLSSWELDLWGRIRSLETAALQNWLASQAGQQSVQLALISQVADEYLGVREIDERVDVARQTVASRAESYRIFEQRHAAGATSKLDLMQVQTLLTQAQSLLTQLERERNARINSLRQLIGGEPRIDAQPQPFDKSLAMPDLPSGLPSRLLTHRPDIIAAEHQLRATNANIGAARAAFFPRIAMTGSFGSASAELDNLFHSGSRAWRFVPTLSVPLFDGGRRRAALELTEVREEIAVAQYEQVIQNAFREVADALSARHWLGEQLSVQHRERDTQSERVRLAQLRYDNGSAAYLEVLDARRDLLNAEQLLVQTRRNLLSSQIALYKALGGGPIPQTLDTLNARQSSPLIPSPVRTELP